MSTKFVALLNESAVTYITKPGKYGWETSERDGFEAISPDGEIQLFTSYDDANKWRLERVISLFNDPTFMHFYSYRID